MCSVCPKKVQAAEPEKVTELSLSAPIAADASATTVRASCAPAVVARLAKSTAAARWAPNLGRNGMGGEYSRPGDHFSPVTRMQFWSVDAEECSWLAFSP